MRGNLLESAAGSVLLFALGRIRRGWLIALLGVIVLIDLVPVNLRYLPQSRFVAARRQQIQPTEADRAILRDPEPGFRVLNLTVSPFNDATTSYFHRSVGGYHGAKLARYQDLIERYLTSMDEGVLDMLNTLYLIRFDPTGQPVAELRATANGPAWFVQEVVDADTPQKEIDALGRIDTKTAAVINTREFDIRPLIGGEGEIRLEEYRPIISGTNTRPLRPVRRSSRRSTTRTAGQPISTASKLPISEPTTCCGEWSSRPVRTRSNGGSAPPAGTSPKA